MSTDNYGELTHLPSGMNHQVVIPISMIIPTITYNSPMYPVIPNFKIVPWISTQSQINLA